MTMMQVLHSVARTLPLLRTLQEAILCSVTLMKRMPAVHNTSFTTPRHVMACVRYSTPPNGGGTLFWPA